MTARSDDEFDPRFDPAFQRGFESGSGASGGASGVSGGGTRSAPSSRRAAVRDDRYSAPPRPADTQSAEAQSLGAQSSLTQPSSAQSSNAQPAQAQSSYAQPAQAYASAPQIGLPPAQPGAGQAISEHADVAALDDQPARPNPFLIALGVVAVALIAAGLWGIQAARAPFIGTDVASNVDFVGLQILQFVAPSALALGVATGIGILFVFAVGWQKRR